MSNSSLPEYAWIAPDGEVFELSQYGHIDFALEYLVDGGKLTEEEYNVIKDTDDDEMIQEFAIDQFTDEGWVRVEEDSLLFSAKVSKRVIPMLISWINDRQAKGKSVYVSIDDKNFFAEENDAASFSRVKNKVRKYAEIENYKTNKLNSFKEIIRMKKESLTIKEIRQKVQDNFACSDDTTCVTFRNGIFTVRDSFFYRHGKDETVLVNQVLGVFPDADIIDAGEVWKAFRGGANVKNQSHWWVQFTVPVDGAVKEPEGEGIPYSEGTPPQPEAMFKEGMTLEEYAIGLGSLVSEVRDKKKLDQIAVILGLSGTLELTEMKKRAITYDYAMQLITELKTKGLTKDEVKTLLNGSGMDKEQVADLVEEIYKYGMKKKSSAYGWIINKDHVADADAIAPSNSNAVGMMGPSNIGSDIQELLNAGEGKKFRMRDDDRELYYEGLYIGDDSEDMFGPLDDFGQPNAGCTMIEYFENGAWKLV